MSSREWQMVSLLERLERGEVTVSEVAASLGRSMRQVQRIRKRVREVGPSGVRHGNRGRSPKHKISEEMRERIVALHRETYAGFNDHHFTEKLAEGEGIEISRETVRRILRARGRGSPRPRRAPRHRRRRERRPQAGQMILWDGSSHDWLEGRGPRLCLMGAVDDATGELLAGAHFTEKEGTVPYLRVLRDILREKGIPHTAYGDCHGSLRRNDKHWSLEEELAGAQEPTQVKLALDRLGIEIVYAMSPQAKGRIERTWGTLQDRLVSELRLAGASTRGQANAVLKRYRLEHNRRFAVPPQESQPAWRKAPSDDLELQELCALQYARKVRKNNTVQLAGRIIDIPPSRVRARGTFAGNTVLVLHLLSGRIHVYLGNECIARSEGPRPKRPERGARSLLGARKRMRQQLEAKRRRDGDEDNQG